MLIIGVDRTFSVLSFVNGKENLRILPPVPQEQIVKLAGKARILLTWSDNKVKLWKIEEINESETEAEEKIEKRYLLEMDFNVSLPWGNCLINRMRNIFRQQRYLPTENISLYRLYHIQNSSLSSPTS